jgi:hypothetical protein
VRHQRFMAVTAADTSHDVQTKSQPHDPICHLGRLTGPATCGNPKNKKISEP